MNHAQLTVVYFDIVDELIGILLSVPIKETGTIRMICEDTLGGYTSIVPSKFAEAFIKRRSMDQQSTTDFTLDWNQNDVEEAGFVSVTKGRKKKK